MKTYAKFALLVVAIVGTLVWLAVGGINETKTYYKTVAEVQQMGNDARGQRLRVGGDVVDGSIVRSAKEVRFVIKQDAQRMTVIYSGSEPLPDTFKGGAQALADGRMNPDGTFQANKIQAKCASKYQSKPPQTPPVNSRAAM